MIGLLVTLLVVLLSERESATAQTTAPAQIEILAGTGAAGIEDGPALQATFLMPSAVAFGPDGTLYVADAAAQRIRAITPSGVVRTIAGGGALTSSGLWVDGGFADGPALEARFYRPSGLAVASDGSIYVADTFNHCIRVIRGGNVSTIGGQCGRAGFKDGGLSVNLLQYPRGISFGNDRALYIADQKNGVRVLDDKGNLRTVDLPASLDARTATSVSAVAGNEEYLYIANVDQITRYGMRSRSALTAYDVGPRHAQANNVQGSAPLGHPYSVAALSERSVVYSDLADGSVRYVEDFEVSNHAGPHVQYVGGTPAEDTFLGIKGRHAGRAFSAPMGLAARDGRFVVGDAIQRKIVLGIISESRHAYNIGLAGLQFGARDYRIAIQGNSFVYFASGFADSIAGVVEQRLREVRTITSKTPRTASLYSTCPDPELVSSGLVDFVVLLVNAYSVDCDNRGRFERNPLVTQSGGMWQALAIRAPVRRFVMALSQAHVRTLVVIIPFPWEIAPSENLYSVENIGKFLFTPPDYLLESNYRMSEMNLLKSVSGLGAPVLNTFPIFRDFEKRPHSNSLFGSDDWHLSVLGRQLVGSAVAAYLKRLKPWRQ